MEKTVVVGEMEMEIGLGSVVEVEVEVVVVVAAVAVEELRPSMTSCWPTARVLAEVSGTSFAASTKGASSSWDNSRSRYHRRGLCTGLARIFIRAGLVCLELSLESLDLILSR
jgi:hypothetical protein